MTDSTNVEDVNFTEATKLLKSVANGRYDEERDLDFLNSLAASLLFNDGEKTTAQKKFLAEYQKIFAIDIDTAGLYSLNNVLFSTPPQESNGRLKNEVIPPTSFCALSYRGFY